MINENNAKQYCCEDISKIENYDKAINDKTQVWQVHHKLEIQGKFKNSKKLLIKCGLYYDVPAWQLIFLTKAEHTRLHNLGKYVSTEAKQKNSEAHFGENNPMYGKPSPNKGKHCSLEFKTTVSNLMTQSLFWNNGVVNKRSKECPGPEWKRGRLPYSQIKGNKI